MHARSGFSLKNHPPRPRRPTHFSPRTLTKTKGCSVKFQYFASHAAFCAVAIRVPALVGRLASENAVMQRRSFSTGLRESLNQNPPSAGKRSAERKDNMTHGTRSPHFGRPTSLFGDSPYLHRARGCSGHCQRFRPTGFSSATKMIGSLNFQWTWQRRRIMPGASSRRTSERTPEGQAR
jgi:hypothetical protein